MLGGLHAGPSHGPGDFATLPPPETEDPARVLARTARRTLLVHAPASESNEVEAAWSLQDDLGVEVLRVGLSIPLTNDSHLDDPFNDGELLSLKANHVHRVTPHVDAQTRIAAQPAAPPRH